MLVCVRAAPGVTRTPPLGRQVALSALPPLEPPAGLGGRLGGEDQTPVEKAGSEMKPICIMLFSVTPGVCVLNYVPYSM